MGTTEARFRDLRIDMNEEIRELLQLRDQEIRELRARVWELEMAPLRWMTRAVYLIAVAGPVAILASSGGS